MESIGIVTEVFIPDDVDLLKSNKIGFKVYLYDEEEEITLTMEQNEFNIDIYKDDEVIVVMGDDDNCSIMLYNGEEYE